MLDQIILVPLCILKAISSTATPSSSALEEGNTVLTGDKSENGILWNILKPKILMSLKKKKEHINEKKMGRI